MKKVVSFVLFCLLVSCSDTVYICTGSYSRRYHKTEYCKGLKKCGGVTVGITKDEARSLNRTPCHICYSKKFRELNNE